MEGEGEALLSSSSPSWKHARAAKAGQVVLEDVPTITNDNQLLTKHKCLL